MSVHGRSPGARACSARTVVHACGDAVLVGLAAVGVLVQPACALALVPLALLAAVITIGRRDLSSPTDRGSQALLPAAMTAFQIYSGGLSLVGLTVVTGSAASSVLTFLALAAAVLWWTRAQRTHGWLLVGDYRPDEPLTPTWHPETATTAQLRLRWRASYLRLGRAPSPMGLAQIAATRRDLLAEFERRDRAGFARFLGSRDPAGRYPIRFCRRVTGHAQARLNGRRPIDTPTPRRPAVRGRRKRQLP